MTLEPGQLVFSIAGRDKGRAYLVMGIDNATYGTFVYVADGKYRQVQRPKRKNIKHLKATKLKAQEIGSRVEAGASLSNVEVRKKLAELLAICQENTET